MARLLNESNPIARKEHYCMACEWLNQDDWWHYGTLTFTELRQVVIAKRNNWKIIKGQKYLRQTVEFEGDLMVFKAIPEINAICSKYNMYEE